jgi:hypothetical protein
MRIGKVLINGHAISAGRLPHGSIGASMEDSIINGHDSE